MPLPGKRRLDDGIAAQTDQRPLQGTRDRRDDQQRDNRPAKAEHDIGIGIGPGIFFHLHLYLSR